MGVSVLLHGPQYRTGGSGILHEFIQLALKAFHQIAIGWHMVGLLQHGADGVSRCFTLRVGTKPSTVEDILPSIIVLRTVPPTRADASQILPFLEVSCCRLDHLINSRWLLTWNRYQHSYDKACELFDCH